jgi:D-alanyl-D-alanine carboxypeptidase
MESMKRSKILILLLAVIIAVLAAIILGKHNPSLPGGNGSKSAGKTAQQNTFDKNLYPTDVSSSLWVIVNKGRTLPSTYVPANLVAPDIPLRLNAANPEMHLRQDAATALQQMAAAAKTDGVNLMLASGYRSYDEQVTVYNGYVRTDGQRSADASSARPGHSEHQTGLAADLEPTSRQCEVAVCFESTAEGQWLAANSYKYGFIIRYQKNTQAITGYEYEPWHVRYVGESLAAQIHGSGQTLEKFFGLPTYPDYPAQMVSLK